MVKPREPPPAAADSAASRVRVEEGIQRGRDATAVLRDLVPP